MTPEETIAHLTAALSRIAEISDGNVNALLKANRMAEETLKAMRPKKKITITIEGEVDPDTTIENVDMRWLEVHSAARENPLIWSVSFP